MRLWSLHPRHLDRAGLVAGWREALLAQAVLAGRTAGYRHHPQLLRFQECTEPLDMIGAYLESLHAEAVVRGYKFDESKILSAAPMHERCSVTQGQLEFEWQHLGKKLFARSPSDADRWEASSPTPHPLFFVTPGDVEEWERTPQRRHRDKNIES